MSNSTFSEHGQVECQIKGTQECSNMVADPTPDPGVNRSKVIFSEHGLVAYQIKGITKWSNLVANTLHHDAPSPTTLGDAIKGSKLNFFKVWP